MRDALRELEYYAPTNSIQIEEQKSNIESIKRLLKASSKSGRGGAGAPEFIITNPENSDFVVIVECKADTADHGSSQATDYLAGNEIHETADQYAKRCQRYAVDGVLHYASSLAKEFNVIAIAVSGTPDTTIEISTYLTTKGASQPKVLKTRDGRLLSALIPWPDYIEHATFDGNPPTN